MFNRDNLFGKGPRAGREQQGGYGAPPQPPPRDYQPDTNMSGYDDPRGSGRPQASPGLPTRKAIGRGDPPPGMGISKQLQPFKVEDKNIQNQYVYSNMSVTYPDFFTDADRAAWQSLLKTFPPPVTAPTCTSFSIDNMLSQQDQHKAFLLAA
jgi:vesicle-fusing ATPase